MRRYYLRVYHGAYDGMLGAPEPAPRPEGPCDAIEVISSIENIDECRYGLYTIALQRFMEDE